MSFNFEIYLKLFSSIDSLRMLKCLSLPLVKARNHL
jgi:hypothetical protein